MAILSESQVNQIVNSEMRDPFELLGMHQEKKGISIRAFLPGAVSVKVSNQNGDKALCEMAKVHDDGVFEAEFPSRKKFFTILSSML